MRSFKKYQIEQMVINESVNNKKTKVIFSKKQLKLKEDNSNAYVEPSSNSASSLASDLARTKSENPTDDQFIVNANSYDSNASNDTVTLDVTGNTPADASKNFQQVTRNPNVKRMMNGGTNVNAKVRIHNESIDYLRENSVKFSKSELDNLLTKK